MITNPNGTKRVQDADLVYTSVFNDVFDSLDKVAITKHNIGVTQSPQTIFSFTPSSLFNNNISVAFYLRLTAGCTISASINYTDDGGAQQFNILNNYYFSSAESYSFSPIFISTTNQPISLSVSSSDISNAVYVSTTASYY